jgi:hypothetical protein
LESNIEWYRNRAADCLELAAKTIPAAKAMLQQMAEEWLGLAEVVERRGKAPSHS